MEDRDTDSYSLDELSELSGYDKRTIRSFIEQGVMRGANSMGRYAHYSSHHLTRLLAIKVLREEKGLQLSSIRTALITMSEDEIKAVVARSSLNLPAVDLPSHFADRPLIDPKDAGKKRAAYQMFTPAEKGTTGGCDPVAPAQPAQTTATSALDYLRGIQSRSTPPELPAVDSIRIGGAESEHAQDDDDFQESGLVASSGRHQETRTAIDLLLFELARIHDQKHVRRQARGESWYCITVTPDIELSVRGIEDAEQLSRLERIADYLREILLGGRYE